RPPRGIEREGEKPQRVRGDTRPLGDAVPVLTLRRWQPAQPGGDALRHGFACERHPEVAFGTSPGGDCSLQGRAVARERRELRVANHRREAELLERVENRPHCLERVWHPNG